MNKERQSYAAASAAKAPESRGERSRRVWFPATERKIIYPADRTRSRRRVMHEENHRRD